MPKTRRLLNWWGLSYPHSHVVLQSLTLSLPPASHHSTPPTTNKYTTLSSSPPSFNSCSSPYPICFHVFSFFLQQTPCTSSFFTVSCTWMIIFKTTHPTPLEILIIFYSLKFNFRCNNKVFQTVPKKESLRKQSLHS